MAEERVISWLLEEDAPSIRYRTLTELLDRNPNGQEALEAKERVLASQPVQKIFQKMHPEGYWFHQDTKRGKGLGDGVEYIDYLTTHFNLAFLSELGVAKEDPRLHMAAERYLNLQQPDGDFSKHLSCLYAYNIHSFIRLSGGSSGSEDD